jgi:hypothetical protein
MKSVVHTMVGLSILIAAPAFAAPVAAAPAAAADATHVKSVQELLSAMQIENVLRGVAARSRYANPAQREAVFAKLEKVPPAEVYRRLAPSVAPFVSTETAVEMTRFYSTPYGKGVIHRKYNNGGGIIMPGMREAVPPEEKKERKRAAYVRASKELADAEPKIEHEAFVLLQAINKGK